MIDIPPEVNCESIPPYPNQAMGCCLVVAMGPGSAADYAAGLAVRRGSHVILVRRAASFYNGSHLYSLDREKLSEFSRFKGYIHSGQPAGNKRAEHYPWIDHWWPGTVGSCTSIWGASRMALFIGFDDVVLCGAPLEVGDYDDGEPAPTFRDMKNINAMRRRIEMDTWMHPYVRSMSGWTAQFLGKPE